MFKAYLKGGFDMNLMKKDYIDSDDDLSEFKQSIKNRPYQSPKLQIQYKQNHHKFPIVILPDHRLLVYTDTPSYSKIYSHLISFAEPIYRPKYVHQYKITKFSLYTAMVLHYSGQQIIEILKMITKNKSFPIQLQTQILQYMRYAGEVRFHLIKDQYFIYTNKHIARSLNDKVQYVSQITIEQAEKYHLEQIHQQLQNQSYQQPEQSNHILQGDQRPWELSQQSLEFQSKQNAQIGKMEEIRPVLQYKKQKRNLQKYLIKGDYFEVTKSLIERNIPLVQEFDFQNSHDSKTINISMISDLNLRYYQERALKNVFIEDIARSGIIILPCGAGKSLVAITIIGRIKKNAVIFCQSQVSAEQWKSELIKWTTIERDKIVILSPKLKDKNPKKIKQCSILITTYAMVGMKRAIENKYLSESQQISWGVCIADEVHKLPAQTFQEVLRKYKFYLKVGLTATPYREDQKINNLFFMIGPKLYEQNWLDLVDEGCLAKPYCVQILCEMPEQFVDAYNKTNSSDLIHTANPKKFKVLQYLLKKHSYCRDKILVFCDRPKVLEYYAKKLKIPYIHGEVSEEERVKIYNLFKTTNDINILFLSRVGDTAIDLPCANVGIQLGMHYKSRRQEVQRMGRIMRAKENPNNEFNAFFYSLVSRNSKEVEYSRKRQRCLVDQGFQYEIIEDSKLSYEGMKLQELDEKDFLLKILSEHEEGDMFLSAGSKKEGKVSKEVVKGDIEKEMEDYYYEQIQEESEEEG